MLENTRFPDELWFSKTLPIFYKNVCTDNFPYKNVCRDSL